MVSEDLDDTQMDGKAECPDGSKSKAGASACEGLVGAAEEGGSPLKATTAEMVSEEAVDPDSLDLTPVNSTSSEEPDPVRTPDNNIERGLTGRPPAVVIPREQDAKVIEADSGTNS